MRRKCLKGNLLSHFFKQIFLLVLFVITLSPCLKAQQMGAGFAPGISSFSDILLSGGYTAHNPIGSLPVNGWQHLFVIRHGNGDNNYQLQIGSALWEDDKLYFRKIAHPQLGTPNPAWIEIATRGSNSFSGDQIMLGSLQLRNGVNLLNSNPGYGSGQQLIFGHSQEGSETPIATIRSFLVNGSSYRAGRLVFSTSFDGIIQDHLIINEVGSVGIGTASPSEKLSVNGTIRSKEIKVEASPWPDYVFEEDYSLIPLSELEAFVKENHHLPEVPTEAEVTENGVEVSATLNLLLKKIEELTLYTIEQQKQLDMLKQSNQELQNKIESIQR